MRADLNVPLDAGEVTDDYRIRSSLPAMRTLRDLGAQVVVCSHLGRPKGPDPELSMRPVTSTLAKLADFPVVQIDGVVGEDVTAAVRAVPDGTVAVLENTRFEPGETKNDPAVAAGLAAHADCFVLDAFGTAHRSHASTVGVAERLPSAAGPLLAAEIAAFTTLLDEPPRPFVVVLGGAKVADKLGVMRHLLPQVDRLVVGGGMCFTLLAARGIEVGASLVDEDRLEEVGALLDEYGDTIVLPVDVVVADDFAADAGHEIVDVHDIDPGAMGLDIGPRSVDRFAEHIEAARAVFWNGPMGVFEWEAFREGTAGVAAAVAGADAYSVIGGGDSVAAIRMLGRDDEVSHVSTGGGAGLELLEGKTLPGIAALQRWSGATNRRES